MILIKIIPVLLLLFDLSSAGGDWLSEVKEKEEKEGNNSKDDQSSFNYPKVSEEFACEVYDRSKCETTEQQCSWQQVCTNGQHNACYAVFTMADANNSSSNGETDYIAVMKGKIQAFLQTIAGFFEVSFFLKFGGNATKVISRLKYSMKNIFEKMSIFVQAVGTRSRIRKTRTIATSRPALEKLRRDMEEPSFVAALLRFAMDAFRWPSCLRKRI